jgi:hypothetical protein
MSGRRRADTWDRPEISLSIPFVLSFVEHVFQTAFLVFACNEYVKIRALERVRITLEPQHLTCFVLAWNKFSTRSASTAFASPKQYIMTDSVYCQESCR